MRSVTPGKLVAPLPYVTDTPVVAACGDRSGYVRRIARGLVFLTAATFSNGYVICMS
jgi:hypothetical protein